MLSHIVESQVRVESKHPYHHAGEVIDPPYYWNVRDNVNGTQHVEEGDPQVSENIPHAHGLLQISLPISHQVLVNHEQ